MSRKKQRIAATARALGLVGGGSLLTAGAANAVEIDDVATPTGACDAGWYYSAQSAGDDVFVATGVPQQTTNDSPQSIATTFMSETSGTVGTTFSGDLNVGVDVAVAEIGATLGIAATTEKTTTYGASVTADVPAWSTVYGQYGVFQASVTGMSQYRTPSCEVTQTVYNTVNVPYREGYLFWS